MAPPRLLPRLLLFAAAYVAAAEAGHLLSFPGNFASLWPPSGLYGPVLLLAGPRRWPAYMAAALAGNLLSDVALHGQTVAVSVGFWAANSVEAVVGAAALKRMAGADAGIDRVGPLLAFLGASVLAGPAACACVGAGVVTAAFGGPYWANWVVWCASAAVGALVLAPALLHGATRRPWRAMTPARRLELLAVVAATGFVGEGVFAGSAMPVAYLCLPVLVTAALRQQVCGAVAATAVLALVAVGNSAAGRGPFSVAPTVAGQVVLTQGFVAVAAALGLLLGALTAERARALAEAEAAHRELEEALAEVRRQAATDALTGLANRGAFDAALADAVRAGGPASLVVLDVDHFKGFNDEYGHPAGDDVLRAVGRVIHLAARGADCAARFGGEEFAVLLPETCEEGAARFAERLRAALEASPWPLRPVTASFGVAELAAEDDARTLLARADAALYRAKRGGRNRVARAAASRALPAAALS